MSFDGHVIDRPYYNQPLQHFRGVDCPVCTLPGLHLDNRVKAGRTKCFNCKNIIIYAMRKGHIALKVEVGGRFYTENDLINRGRR